VVNFYLSVSLQGFSFTDNVTTTAGYSLGKVVGETDCSCSHASKYGKIL